MESTLWDGRLVAAAKPEYPSVLQAHEDKDESNTRTEQHLVDVSGTVDSVDIDSNFSKIKLPKWHKFLFICIF